MYRRRSALALLVAIAGAATGARDSVRGGRRETTGAALPDPARRRRGRRRTRRAAYPDYNNVALQGLRLEDTPSEETGESDSCPFCAAGLDDPGRILPTSDEITCGELAEFTLMLRPTDRLCHTAMRAEYLCCTAQGPMEEASATSTEPASTAGTGCGTVYYTVASETEEFSTLVDAINASGLRGVFENNSTLTLFAPSNSAFENLPEDALRRYFDPVWRPQLRDLLLYHTLGSEVYSSDLSDGLEAPTVNFAKETVLFNLDPARVNDNSLILADDGLYDVEACNGVVHEVSEVLLPTSATSDIVDLVAASDDLSTLAAAVEAAGLAGTLKGEGPFTLFAPSDEAFAALPDNLALSLLDEETLVSILTYHVVPANALSTSLESSSLETVNGADVNITVSTDGITVNDASVIQANVIASNGIVHVIDAVLLPPEKPEEPEASQTTESPPITLTTEEPEAELTTDSPAPVTEAPLTEAPVTEAAQTTAAVTDRPAAETTDAATDPATTTESTGAPVKTTEIAQAAQTTVGSTDPTVAETTIATDAEPATVTAATEAPKSTDAPASAEWGSGEHAIFAGKSSKEAKGGKEAKGKQAKLFKPAGTLDGPTETTESGKASKLFTPYILSKSKKSKSSKGLFAPHIGPNSEKEGKSSKGLFAKASDGHSMKQETGAEIAKPHSSISKSNKAPVDGMSIAAAGKATKQKPHAGGKATKDDAGMLSLR